MKLEGKEEREIERGRDGRKGGRISTLLIFLSEATLSKAPDLAANVI